jgi:predicted nucleotidyltransferase
VVSAKAIIDYVDAIAAKFKPRRIILFGSYAYGTPTADSDVDLLVVKEFRGSNAHQILRIRRDVDFAFPVDILVHRPKDISRRIGWNDFFLKEATEQGLVLYDADDRGVGEKGRRRLRRRLRPAAVA